MTSARRLYRARPTRRSADALLVACALANVGGMVAYLPLLGLMLPMRVEAIAGVARIGALSFLAIVGLTVASIANIAFGWLSDRTLARGGTRRRGVIGGLALLSGAYAAVAIADDLSALTVAIVAVQVAVNAILAPMFAWFAEAVPDARKGMLGGLIAWAQPAASGLAALLITVPLPGEAARLAAIPLAVALLLAPLLVRGEGVRETAEAPVAAVRRSSRGLVIATAARLLVQVAGSVVGLYLLYYLESVAPQAPVTVLAARTGTLMTVAALIPLPLALAAGRWSDRTGRRRPVLVASAIAAAVALGVMAGAGAGGWLLAAAGYAAFVAACAVFLSLNAGFALQLLPDPRHRGRDLGLFNLANTLPALIGPALAWWLATPHDFSALLLLLAAIVTIGGVVVWWLPEGQRAAQ